MFNNSIIAGSINISDSTTSNEVSQSITDISSIKIEEIKVFDKIVHFKKPLAFKVKCDNSILCNFCVASNLINIYEHDSNIEKLKEKIKEDLSIQWEDIVMADDSELFEDAIKLKKYLLSFM